MSSKSGTVRFGMSQRWGIRAGRLQWISVTFALALLSLSMGPFTAGAGADTGAIIAPSDPQNPTPDSGWQAGTCKEDSPTCSVATPKQFFEQAAGHPPVGFTQFTVKSKAPGETPVG